jgi:predicted nucleotide-binding protein (sugar kinase/HSP70/actin superfamily)
MLKRNYGSTEKIVEQLLEKAKTQLQLKNSNDFKEFSNLVEDMSVAVKNVKEMVQFTSKVVIRGLL